MCQGNTDQISSLQTGRHVSPDFDRLKERLNTAARQKCAADQDIYEKLRVLYHKEGSTDSNPLYRQWAWIALLAQKYPKWWEHWGVLEAILDNMASPSKKINLTRFNNSGIALMEQVGWLKREYELINFNNRISPESIMKKCKMFNEFVEIGDPKPVYKEDALDSNICTWYYRTFNSIVKIDIKENNIEKFQQVIDGIIDINHRIGNPRDLSANPLSTTVVLETLQTVTAVAADQHLKAADLQNQLKDAQTTLVEKAQAEATTLEQLAALQTRHQKLQDQLATQRNTMHSKFEQLADGFNQLVASSTNDQNLPARLALQQYMAALLEWNNNDFETRLNAYRFEQQQQLLHATQQQSALEQQREQALQEKIANLETELTQHQQQTQTLAPQTAELEAEMAFQSETHQALALEANRLETELAHQAEAHQTLIDTSQQHESQLNALQKTLSQYEAVIEHAILLGTSRQAPPLWRDGDFWLSLLAAWFLAVAGVMVQPNRSLLMASTVLIPVTVIHIAWVCIVRGFRTSHGQLADRPAKRFAAGMVACLLVLIVLFLGIHWNFMLLPTASHWEMGLVLMLIGFIGGAVGYAPKHLYPQPETDQEVANA